MKVEPIFRRARSEDATALAELIWIAGESSSRSVYEVLFGGDRDSQRERLQRLILAQTRTHFSYCNFFVAEVHGIAVAGACGFNPRNSGKQNLLPALRETAWTPSEIADAMERMGPVLTCAAEESPDAWVLEHVASLPRFRGRGLAREVVFRVIEEGFAAGFDRVELSVLVGNEVARKLYVNLGFRLEGRPRTDPRFEAVMGSPGMETLALSRRAWIPPSTGNVPSPRPDFEGRNADAVESSLAFWERKLEGAPPFVDLPTDRARPVRESFVPGALSRVVGREIGAGVEELSRREAASPFTVLFAAFNLLLSRLSGQEDLVVGSADIEEANGGTRRSAEFSVNKLALRTDVSGNPTFRELLKRVRSVALEALAQGHVPFERIVERVQPAREFRRPPIFQIFFKLLDNAAAELALPRLAGDPVELPEVESHFDLTLCAAEQPEGLRLIAVYNADLFDEPRMREMLEQFATLLEQIVAEPGNRIGSYSLTTESSRQLLPDPAVTLAEPEVGLAVGRFLSVAARAPGATAIVDAGRVLSYAELEAHSRNIAESLIDQGLARGEVVAVTGARSAGLVASMLGVLRSGGVLLTLDPALPTQRRKLMVSEAGARRIVLAGGGSADERLPGLAVTEVRQDGALAGSRPGHVDLPTPSPDDPAYIFFTSGTSGVPKGVLGSQKGLAHFLKWQRETFAIGPGDRCAQLTGLSFDVVLRDVFLPLTSGASLHLPNLDGDTVASKILVWLEREGITALHTVPAIAQSWLAAVPGEARLARLRWAFFAGEPLTDGLVRRWFAAFPESGRIVNLYGPTETTLAKCFFVVPQDPPAGIQPVGRPLPDTQALVLAEGGRPCGIGEIGEIVLRTPFRTLGYVNAPDEQRVRFVTNPFRNDPRDLFYRTGDRGRYLPDGSLKILGRGDDQVKIRGVRVEPEEVAVVLSRHPAVASCAVVPRRREEGEIDLVAYLVSRGDPPVTGDELRRELARHLSSVMIPSAFVFLNELPLTPNGKLDRAALLALELAAKNPRELVAAPRTPIEEVIASTWASVLGVESVGVDDNFFELGGHSLKAAQVVSRVGQAFGLDLPLRALFEAPTVGLLASRVEESLLDEVQNEIPAEASEGGHEGSAFLDRKAVLD